MDQLRGELSNLGWSGYEADCYLALVKFGEMKASQIAARIDVQTAKVYQPLNRLHERGYVKVRGENPKRYVAQNPRYVIEQEQQEFRERSNDVLEGLEEAWEVQMKRGPSEEESARVLSGQDGMNTELQDLVEDAEEAIIGFDTRLSWATRGVIESLEGAVERGVDVNIIGRPHAGDTLDRLKEAGAETLEIDGPSRSSYYVVDGESVLLNIGMQDATVSFDDSDLAGIIMEDFDKFSEGEAHQ